MIVVAISISIANAQLVSSSRDPDVIGYVTDDAPFNFSGDGDGIGSGAFISNLNGTLAKAVLEYDISDIMPGVLVSARITGTVAANNGLPLGERRHSFSISAGDGVLNTADNAGAGFSIGSIIHEAGDRSDYDYDITRAFRSVVLEDTGYLKQRVSPSSANDQGWDAVSIPKLELSLRPTDVGTTVYYQPPVASGEATRIGIFGFTVDQSATSMEVWTSRTSFESSRGIVEYDVSSIPANAEILWAVLDVQITGYSFFNDLTLTMEMVGYQGDGFVEASDVNTPSAVWTGSPGQIQEGGFQSWAIDPEFVETILQNGNHLGLLFQPGDNSGLSATIQLADFFGDESGRPHLAIAYTVPTVLLGDVDLDGAITFLDIFPFISILIADGFQAEADCNGDGRVGFLDIAPFIAILGSQ